LRLIIIKKFIRTLIGFTDFLLLKLWLLRFTIGNKMWGTDYRIRQINHAPSHYLIIILQRLGADIHDTVTFKNGLMLDNIDAGLNRLKIADKAYLGPGVFLDLAAPITIETEAVLAPQVMLLTHGDVGDRMLAKVMARKAGPIILRKGCWIGARATILPGITVGVGAVVGAGAVVTVDVPDYTVVAGVPARYIRMLNKNGSK
jgi:acetyltransferase-like isoleucine patch superfamily enzyme